MKLPSIAQLLLLTAIHVGSHHDVAAFSAHAGLARSHDGASRAATSRLDAFSASSSDGEGDIHGRRGTSSLPITDSRWACHNDFQTFLNQCAAQSLVFLMNSLRDRQTALWLEEFSEPVFHRREKESTGRDHAISTMAKAAKTATGHADTSASPMLNQQSAGGVDSASSDSSGQSSTHDSETGNVEIKMLSYHGLGLGNTTKFPTWETYFEQLLQEPTASYTIESSSRFVPNYELEINPASICSRLISVREQIAREWRKDLDVIADMGGQMMDVYWERQQQQQQQQQQEEGAGAAPKASADAEVDMATPSPESTFQRANLLFLEMSPDNSNDYCPSPLRKGNFDLLTLLTTQESIHRILNSADAAARAPAEVTYLGNFYSQRVGTHFTGSQWYGRADDFLEQLLLAGPTRVQVQDEHTAMVDPLRIVEMILEEREQVADDWLHEVTRVPESHMAIKRIQLNMLMGIGENEVNTAFE